MNPEIMKALGFTKELEAIKAGQCPFCQKMIQSTEFQDALSRKEYQISGLCQDCQDFAFSGEGDDR